MPFTIDADERKKIGYIIAPIYETPPGVVVTQAMIYCCGCAEPIASVGGPMANAFCLKCMNKANP